MSVAAPAIPLADDRPPLPVRRFSVEEYHGMIRAGILTEDDAVELLEGWIIPKMPRRPIHDATVLLVEQALRGILTGGWHLRPQCAVTTGDSEPEPDLAIVRGAVADYLEAHPTPADIVIVIEVSDSTLRSDREIKGRLYARAGVAVYWLVNLVDLLLEVYTDPTGPGGSPEYRQRRSLRPDENVGLALNGRQAGVLQMRQLLPPSPGAAAEV